MDDKWLKDREILVTGGAGFIGSHLVDDLVRKGTIVTVLDNLRSGNLRNLEDSLDEVEFVKGDIGDRVLVDDVIEGKDFVFHLAANASVPQSVQNPRVDYEINSTGTFNLLNACRKGKVKNFLYASTAAVYGEPIYTPIDESHPLNPISPYGASKLSGEMIGFAFKKCYGISFTSLRIFNVYGPRQRKYVLYDLIEKLKENPKSLEVLGSGEQERSFCYVKDAVEAFLLAAKRDEGIVYNLAGDTVVKIRNLAKLIVLKISPRAKIRFTKDSWKGDIQRLIPDNSKIKKELGFEEKIPFDTGVDELIDWLEQKQNRKVETL